MVYLQVINKISKFYYFLPLVLCLVLITSCISEKATIKAIRSSDFTAISSYCFKKPKEQDTLFFDKAPNKKQLKKIGSILKEKLYYFRRALPIEFPKTKIKVKNSDGLNARIFKKEIGKKKRKFNSIVIDLGVLRKSIKQSLVNAVEYTTDKQMKGYGFFESDITNSFEYYYLLHNYKPKKVNIFKLMSLDEDNDILSDEFIDLHTITIALDRELSKLVTFIVFHEAGHILNNCDQGKRCELDCDLTALTAYYVLYGLEEGLFNSMFADGGLPLGRSLKEIIQDIYTNTIFEEPKNKDRPSLEERTNQIDSLDNLIQNELEINLFKLLEHENN